MAGGGQVRPALADPVREIERQAERVDALLQRARMSLDTSLTGAATTWRTPGPGCSPCRPPRRCAAATRSCSTDDGVVRGAAEVEPGETLTVRFAADQLTVRASDDLMTDRVRS